MSRDIRRNYNISDDYLKGIYDDIQQHPITLVDDEVAKLKQESALANGIKKKRDVFIKECMHMVKRGKELIRRTKPEEFEEVTNAIPLKAMFEVAWSGMLAAFSSLFEEQSDRRIWDLCLDGLHYSILITSTFNMSLELDAFASTLEKFTNLRMLKEIKRKNIECIKLFITIAESHGNYLRNAWLFLLQCLSKLDYVHSIANTLSKDSLGAQQKYQPEELEAISTIAEEISQAKIDSIFARSVSLDAEAIIELINSLCKVSKDELFDRNNPRIFSLQKLVEVADLNMSRITYVW